MGWCCLAAKFPLSHSLTLHLHEGRGENEIKMLMSSHKDIEFPCQLLSWANKIWLGVFAHAWEESSTWSTTCQISSFPLVLPLFFFFFFLLSFYYLTFCLFFYCVFLEPLHPHLWAQLCPVVGGFTWSICVQHGAAPGLTDIILLHLPHWLDFNLTFHQRLVTFRLQGYCLKEYETK